MRARKKRKYVGNTEDPSQPVTGKAPGGEFVNKTRVQFGDPSVWKPDQPKPRHVPRRPTNKAGRRPFRDPCWRTPQPGPKWAPKPLWHNPGRLAPPAVLFASASWWGPGWTLAIEIMRGTDWHAGPV